MANFHPLSRSATQLTEIMAKVDRPWEFAGSAPNIAPGLHTAGPYDQDPLYVRSNADRRTPQPETTHSSSTGPGNLDGR